MLLIKRVVYLFVAILLSTSLAHGNGNAKGGGTEALLDSSLELPTPAAFRRPGRGRGSPPQTLHENYARQPIREDLTPYGVDLLGEQFDLGMGSLSFSHTDVSIPGNSGLEVALRRSFDAAQGHYKLKNDFGDWELDIPRIEMITAKSYGWPDTRCSRPTDPPPIYYFGVTYEPHEYWNGLKILIPGTGTKYVLDLPLAPVRDSVETEKHTSNYWDIQCEDDIGVGLGEGFIATSPDGIVYTFKELRYLQTRPAKKNNKLMPRQRAQMLVTRVADRFGNYVDYNYAADKLTSITSSDSRTITISYVPSTNRVSTVTANGRTWTYSYRTNSYSEHYLSKVTLPSGQAWTFDLEALFSAATASKLLLGPCPGTRNVKTGSVTHPYGAVGTYTLTETGHGRTDVPKYPIIPGPSGCAGEGFHAERSFNVMSLSRKTLTGPGLATMTWDYDYSENQGGWAGDGTNPLKTTTVTNPDSSKDVYHYDRSWSYLEGALIKVQKKNRLGTVLETTKYDYEDGPQRGSVVGDLFYENTWTMTSPRSPKKTTVTRGSDSFYTEKTYDNATTSSNFSFGNPIEVDQSNSFSNFSRTDKIDYLHDLTHWELGRTTTVTVGSEAVSENHYDTNNRLHYVDRYGVRVKEFSYNTDGTVAWQKDALGNQVTFTNWKRGVPQSVTYPDSTTHIFAVDNNGWLTKSTDAKNQATSYTYDKIGRITLVNYPDEPRSTRLNKTIAYALVDSGDLAIPGGGLAAGQWKQTKTRGELTLTSYFDALLRPVLSRSEDTTDPGLDRFTRSVFNHRNQPTFSSFPSATATASTGTNTVYDALSRVIEFAENVAPFAETTFDYLNGNKTRITNPRGKQTTTTYYALGLPDQSAPTLIEQPESVRTTIVRNDFGEMTSATQAGGGVTATRNYLYNSRHLLCRQVDPETGSTAYKYQNNGRLQWYAPAASGGTGSCNISSVPSVERIEHTYYPAGQLKKINYPDSTPDLTFGYDDNGNLESVTSSDANWTYAYSKANALIQEELVTNGQTFTSNYGFDTQDRLTSITYPSRQVVSIVPNAYGEPKSVGSYASGIKYHANGSIASLTYGNNRVYTTSQNHRQLPLKLKVMDGVATVAELEHLYDANGNITTIADRVTSTASRAMTYDDLDRLKTANGIWGNGTYAYDVLGNIKTKNEGSDTISITYDSNNVIDDVLINTTSRSYSHDGYGNVTNNGVQMFTYNLAGSLVTSSGPTVTHYYDGLKRRVRRQEGTDTTYTMYGQGGTMLHKEDDGVETDYIYAGSMLIAKKEGTAVHYLHTDLLGSPIDGAVGATSYTENYTPWGEKWGSPIQLANDIGYTGHQSDVATGFTYMQARYYDPVVARFMAADPVGFSSEYPMSFNRYSYANANPLRYHDPDGKAAVAFEVEVETKLGGIVSWAITRMTGKEMLAGGGQGSIGIAISFPAFDGAKFDAGVLLSGSFTDVMSGGSPLPSTPGMKGGAILSFAKGSVSDLAGRSYSVQGQTNIGKSLTKKLTAGLPSSVRNYAEKGLSAVAGLVVSGGFSFDEQGNLSGAKIGAAKGLNIGVSADLSHTVVCSVRDGCNK